MVKLIFEKENLLVGNRFLFAAGLIVIMTLILCTRVWYLQVVKGNHYQKVANNNHISKQYIPAARGKIFDRHGQLILGNRAFYDLVFVPQYAKKPELLMQKITAILGVSQKHLEKRLRLGRTSRAYAAIPLVRDLSLHQVSMIEARIHELPGIYIQTTPRRDYKPWTPAHLIGYLREVSPAKVKKNKQQRNPYMVGDLVGAQGLEKQWEEHLRGQRGYRLLKVDAFGSKVNKDHQDTNMPEHAAHNGHDLILTLDLDLQRATRKAFQGKNGAVVVMEPNTGEILAAVSEPTFDISLFQGRMSWDRWRALSQNPFTPLLDKTTGGEFPPGSLYKAVVAAAGLEEGLITESTSTYCPGHYTLGGERFHCHKRTGHGRVNVITSMKYSCDIFFYELGMLLGVDRIAKYARAFGLGKPLGLKVNSERAGLIPTKDWHKKRFGRKWPSGETPNISIGQGFNLLTPLQMASLYASLANEGTVWKPYVVKKVLNHLGETVFTQDPEKLQSVDIVSPKTFAILKKSLKSVVHSRGGTGTRAAVKGHLVAGKTGTAQVVSLNKITNWADVSMRWKEHAIFAAFSPIKAPEIVVLVYSQHDSSGGGGTAAAPVAQKVLQAYYDLKAQHKRVTLNGQNDGASTQ